MLVRAIRPQKWIPAPYMKRAVRFLVDHAYAALFLDPGLRKTSITLKAFSALQKAGVADRALVVAPLRVCYGVWPAEVQKWLEFKHLKVVILHGPRKEKMLEEDADIYVINPEGLSWLLTPSNIKKLKADTLVIDESTKFKNTATSRFKSLKPYLPKFERRWILTGTPVPNGYMDLFGQIYICDLGKTLGQYITHYRMQFFSPAGFKGYDWKINDGAEKLINARIKPFVLRLDAKDYIQLPELIVNPIWVELPPKARQIYDDMEDILIASLESGERVTAINGASSSQKCEQIANGGLYIPNFIPTDDVTEVIKGPRKWENIHEAKIDALTELRESLGGGQLMIVYQFAHDLSRIQAALYGKKPGPYLGGGVSPKRGVEIEYLWNSRELRDLPCQPQSAGHGLNLQDGGNHIAWHSPTWDLELWDQFNGRLRRSGSRHPRIFAHLILAKDTVDEVKWATIQSKDKTQSGFLNALKSYARQRR